MSDLPPVSPIPPRKPRYSGLLSGVLTALALATLPIAGFIVNSGVGAADAQETTPPVAAATPATPAPGQIDVAAALAERSIGNADAPVVMFEYSSLTCPHCARFNTEILPQLKTKYVETGILRIVKRDYPIDQTALTAATAARCLPEKYYFRFISALFTDQENWARAEDPAQAVFNMARLLGMDEATFDACIENKELLEGILKGVQEGQEKYDIRATPTLVFNNGAKVMAGVDSVDAFSQVIDDLAAKAGK